MCFSVKDRYLFSLFYQPLLTLASSVFVQSSIKYVLTQGDSILIASLASLEDQGAYALSSNYGGLIARMLFQPIEDASRNLFAKLCAPATAPKDSETTVKDEKTTVPAKATNDGIKQAKTTLTDILKFYNIISLVAFSFGPTLAPLLLQIVAGSRWSDTGAGEVLGTYCYYIPLLAINGVTEAFVAAVANNADLYRQSVWMGGFFAGFAASAYVFLRILELGARGLVWTNCVNSGLRILFNLNFVQAFFSRNGEVCIMLSLTEMVLLTSSVVVRYHRNAAYCDEYCRHLLCTSAIKQHKGDAEKLRHHRRAGTYWYHRRRVCGFPVSPTSTLVSTRSATKIIKGFQ